MNEIISFLWNMSGTEFIIFEFFGLLVLVLILWAIYRYM